MSDTINELIGSVDSGNELVGVIESNSKEINVNVIGGGARGRSAYEVWLYQGNTGTVEDFLGSLKGEKGVDGYIHPATHSADMIVETTNKMFLSSTEKANLSGYVHDQIASSNVWIVNHPLNKYPSVSVVDSGGNLVMGEVEYISKSRLILTFTGAFSGKVYLN